MAHVVKSIASGAFDDDLKKLKEMDGEGLRKVYTERQMEPHLSEEGWIPDDKTGLVS